MWRESSSTWLVGRTLLHDNDHFVCLLFVSVDGENAVCPAEKGIKKALHPQRGTKDKQFRGTTHIRRTFCAALFRYRIYPIPVTEETRLRLLGILSARQLKRNFIVPASASVSSHDGRSLKAALGTITFLCHRFVQYLSTL